MPTSLVLTGVQFPDNTIQTTAATGGGGSTAITTSTTLTASSTQIQVMTMTGWGSFVQFPNATTMTTGEAKFVLVNRSADFPVGVLNGAGQVLGQVLPNDTTSFDLLSNATSAGDWAAQGNLDPVWFSSKTLLNIRAANTGTLNVVPVNSNTALLPYTNGSSQFCVRVLRLNGSSAPTVSPEVVLVSGSLSIGTEQAVQVGTNRVLIWLDNTRVILLDFTNVNSPSVGAALTFSGMQSAEIIMPLDSQYAILFGRNSSSFTLQAICFDCGTSGTTVTAGTAVNSAGFAGATPIYMGSPVPVGTTAYGLQAFIFGGGGWIEYNAFTVTRTSGTTLSFSSGAGNPPSTNTSSYDNNTSQVFNLGGGRRLWWYAGSTFANFMVITFTAGATPTYGTTVQSTQTGNNRNLRSNPDQSLFVFTANGSSNTNYFVEAITVSGATVTKGTAQQFSSNVLSNSPQTFVGIQNNGRGALIWSDTNSSSNRINQFRTFSISGTTFTFGSEMQSPAQLNFPGIGSFGNMSFTLGAMTIGSVNGGNTLQFQNNENTAEGAVQARIRLFTVNADRSITFLSDTYTSTNPVEAFFMVGNTNQVVQNFSLFRPTSGLRPFNVVITPSTGRQKTGSTIVGSFITGPVAVRTTDSTALIRPRYNIGVIPGDINVGASVEIFTYVLAEA